MRPTVKQKPPEQPKVAPRTAPRATAPLTPGRPVRLANQPSAPAGPPKAARAPAQAPLTPGPGGQPPARGPPQAQRALPAKRAAQEHREEDEEVVAKPRPKPAAPGAPQAPGKPPPLKQQIESYFSEQGLKQDVYLRDIIESSPGGWVDVEDLLNLKRIKALRATKDDVLHALSTGTSWLEVFESEDGISAAVRRPENRPIPQVQQPAVAKSTAREPLERSIQARGPIKPGGTKRPMEPIRPGKASGRTLLPGRMEGLLSSYDEESGDATISCAQTEALFQKDVTLTWQELEKAGTAINIGSLVSFLVELGPNGDPQARDLQFRIPEEEEEEGEEEDAEEQEMRPAKKQKTTEVEEATLGSRYTGTFKSFNTRVNIGLIACKETHTTFGRDVAVDKDECAGFVPGEIVSFELFADEMGTPKAVNLEAPPEAEDSEILPPTAKSARLAPRPPSRPPPKLPTASSRPLTPPRSGPAATFPAAPKLPGRAAAPGRAMTPGKAPGPGKAPAPGKATSTGLPGARSATISPSGKAPARPANGMPENGNAQAKGAVKLTAKAGSKADVKAGSSRPSPVAKPPMGPPPKALLQRQSPSTPTVALSGRWQGVVKSVSAAMGSGRISFTGKRPMANKSEVTVTEAELTGFVVGDAVSFSLEKEPKSGILQATELEADDEA
mmetsp:Transcript_48920/g.91553  ORF Transcript_48920/g.91553 Transcript_48920/m.91553 type:complete len:671 (+) Transcript_48920:114-2126(+)